MSVLLEVNGISVSFDGFKAIYDGVEKVGPDSKLVKEFLQSYNAFGALGKIAFDSNGDILNLSWELKEIKQGQIVSVLGK